MPGNSVKNKKTYKALKRKGMSKTRAAKIANAGKSASKKRAGARVAPRAGEAARSPPSNEPSACPHRRFGGAAVFGFVT